MIEESCWIILLKSVNSQYRSETILKQISLQVFLNYCSKILVVGFVVISQGFLSGFSKSRSSDLKAFCKKMCFKKISEFKGKHLCQCLLLKLCNVWKKRLWHRSFYVNFTKFKCFVEAVLRTSTKVCFWNRVTFQTTSSLFLKESVVFNCLNIKNNKTWSFLIHPPLISFRIMLSRHISISTLFKKIK